MSYLEKVIESYIQKPKITVTRLNEQSEELPSNIHPETATDMMMYSIRDLKGLKDGIRSHLQGMRSHGGADERLILQLEQETDILDGVIARLEKATKMSVSGFPMTSDEEHRLRLRQYGEAAEILVTHPTHAKATK